MSLTSELRDTKSPTYHFMRERLPNVSALRPEWREQVAAAQTIMPDGEEALSHLGTVGTAIDYRLRYYFPEPIERKPLVAEYGALFLATGQHPSLFVPIERDPSPLPQRHELSQAFFERNAALVSSIAPATRLDRTTEDLLCRHCLVLGLFDQVYRAGLEIRSPLYELPPGSTVDDVLGIVPDAWVDDMRRMSWAFFDSSASMLCLPAVLNPTFEGSKDVRGADADLIAGDCLVDFKAHLHPKQLSAQDVYQLVGYVLLDYSDAYGIKSAGFYLARQALLIRWQLTQLLPVLAGRDVGVERLRRDFSALLRDSRVDTQHVGEAGASSAPSSSKRVPKRKTLKRQRLTATGSGPAMTGCEHDWRYVRRVRIWIRVGGARAWRHEYTCPLCSRTSFTKDRRILES